MCWLPWIGYGITKLENINARRRRECSSLPNYWSYIFSWWPQPLPTDWASSSLDYLAHTYITYRDRDNVGIIQRRYFYCLKARSSVFNPTHSDHKSQQGTSEPTRSFVGSKTTKTSLSMQTASSALRNPLLTWLTHGSTLLCSKSGAFYSTGPVWSWNCPKYEQLLCQASDTKSTFV